MTFRRTILTMALLAAVPILTAVLALASVGASADVVRIDVEQRDDVAEGASYGNAGSYERLAGRIHFAVDPSNPANRIVTDIDFAPANGAGLVEFSADFVLVKPKDLSAGYGAVFFGVANRGRIAAWKSARLAGPA